MKILYLQKIQILSLSLSKNRTHIVLAAKLLGIFDIFPTIKIQVFNPTELFFQNIGIRFDFCKTRYFVGCVKSVSHKAQDALVNATFFKNHGGILYIPPCRFFHIERGKLLMTPIIPNSTKDISLESLVKLGLINFELVCSQVRLITYIWLL
jgi:hypothetical protein